MPHIKGAEDDDWRWHGTATLGVLAAKDDGKGIVGVAPRSRVRTVSSAGAAGMIYRPEAGILAALNAVRKRGGKRVEGDILLIEEQLESEEPVELEDSVYTAIVNAVVHGWVVIEPAANGRTDLDQATSNDQPVLRRGGPRFRDSEPFWSARALARKTT